MNSWPLVQVINFAGMVDEFIATYRNWAGVFLIHEHWLLILIVEPDQSSWVFFITKEIFEIKTPFFFLEKNWYQLNHNLFTKISSLITNWVFMIAVLSVFGVFQKDISLKNIKLMFFNNYDVLKIISLSLTRC
jgi:hypothetical protein